MKKIIIAVIIILILVIWHKKGKFKLPGIGTVVDSKLEKGSQGLDVRRLQMKLNQLVSKAVNEEIPISYSLDGHVFYPITQPLVVDGVFGSATEVMLFAITGKKSIMASEIDSIDIVFTT